MLGNLFKKNKETYSFQVKGMSCQGCVKTIKNFLSSQDGIYEVEVSLENNSAKVVVDKKKWNPEKIKNAVREIGYELI